MVVIRPLEASRSIDIGGIPDTRVDSSVGQGLAQVGNAIGNHADMQNQMQMRRLQMEKQLSEFKTDQEYERFKADRKADFIKIKEGTDPSGQGLTEATVKNYHENATEFIRNVPDFLKPKYSELLLTGNVAVNHFAAGQQAGMMHDWSATNITERAQKLQIDIANNPDSYADAKKNIIDYIDAAPGLSKSERDQAKKDAEKFFAAGVGDNIKARAAQDPNAVADLSGRLGIGGLRGSPVDAVVSQIIGVESSGRADAKNPNSSASGLGQFIDSTWLGMVRKHRPDIASGRSNAEIIALKTDPKLGREMTRAYTLENAQFLANQGIEQTAGNIYLAHFLGPRGAALVLKAAPNTPIENIVGPQVIQANGFLRGKSASEVAAWATGKMGNKNSSSVPVDPRFSQMSLDDRLKLYDEAMAAANTGITKRNAEWTAKSNQENDRIRFGIVQGTITSEQDIANNSYLDLGQRAERITQFRTEYKKTQQTQADVASILNGNFSGDPYASEFQKRADNAFSFAKGNLSSDDLRNFTESQVRQSGYVPQPMLNQLRAGAESQIAAEVLAAMQQASRFNQINPTSLGRGTGGDAIQRKVDDFEHYVNRLDMKPEDAARRIAEDNDPSKVRDRKALEPAAKEFRKSLEGANLASMFNEGWTRLGRPNIGFTEQQGFGISADYLAIADKEFYATSGNAELAKSRAEQEMKRLYGVTDITGTPTVMKNPPDKIWPAMRSPSDPYGYIKDQLVNDLALAFPDDASLNPTKDSGGTSYRGKINGREVFIADESGLAEYRKMVRDNIMSRVAFVSTEKTDAEKKQNQLPGYKVLFKDETGFYQSPFYEKQWKPDLTNVKKAQEQRVERAYDYQKIGRGIGEYISGGDIPMGAGSAWDNPEAQQVTPITEPAQFASPPATETPTIKGALKDNRSQLFKDAQDSGMLTGGVN